MFNGLLNGPVKAVIAIIILLAAANSLSACSKDFDSERIGGSSESSKSGNE